MRWRGRRCARTVAIRRDDVLGRSAAVLGGAWCSSHGAREGTPHSDGFSQIRPCVLAWLLMSTGIAVAFAAQRHGDSQARLAARGDRHRRGPEAARPLGGGGPRCALREPPRPFEVPWRNYGRGAGRRRAGDLAGTRRATAECLRGRRDRAYPYETAECLRGRRDRAYPCETAECLRGRRDRAYPCETARSQKKLRTPQLASPGALLERANPTLASCQAFRVVFQDLFDSCGQRCDGSSCSRPLRRNQDQTSVRSSLGQPFSCKRPKVLDVVGDHCTVLSRRCSKDNPVAASDQVTPFCHGNDVVAGLAQPGCDQRRQLLVDERLHTSSARRPATAAAWPRSYSASLSSICSSISSRNSP